MAATTLSAIGPMAQLRAGRLGRRIPQLLVGLWIYGLSMAMMIRSHLGLDPWDVFHSGVVAHVSLSFGTVVVIVGALVLLLWIPLRQAPGLGTIANVILIGVATDVSLATIHAGVGFVGSTSRTMRTTNSVAPTRPRMGASSTTATSKPALGCSSSSNGRSAGSRNTAPVAWAYSRATPRRLRAYPRSGVTLISTATSSSPRSAIASAPTSGSRPWTTA